MTPEEYEQQLGTSLSCLQDPFAKMRAEREKLWRDGGDSDIREHSFHSIGFRLTKLAKETKIARLEQESFQACHELQMKEEEAESIKNQIEKLRAQREVSERKHVQGLLDQETKLERMKKRYKEAKKEFEADGHIYQYAKAMTEPGKNPDYVKILQARLCRAVHHFAVFEAHVKLADGKSMLLINQEKEHLQTQMEEYAALEDLSVKFFTLAYEEQIYRLNDFKEAVKPQKEELFRIQTIRRDAHKKEMQMVQSEMDGKKKYQKKSVSFNLKEIEQEPQPIPESHSMSYAGFNFKHNVSNDAHQVLESKLTQFHSPLKVLEDHLPKKSFKKNNKRAMAA